MNGENPAFAECGDDTKRYFNELFGDTPDAVILCDHNHRFVQLNAAALELLGRKREELLGTKLDDLVLSPTHFSLTKILDQLEKKHACAGEFELERADGERRSIELTATPNALHGYHLLIIHDITQHSVTEAELEYLALHDSLTGLANRHHFLDCLKLALTSLSRNNWVAVLFVDFDHFKQINDQLGHQIGDEALAAASKRVESAIRPEDLAARYGGDELAILCKDLHDKKVAQLIAGRIIDALRQPFTVGGHEVTLRTSIGVSFAMPGQDEQAVVAAGDQAMYEAKVSGGNRYVVRASDSDTDKQHNRLAHKPS
jgi:diguanylate cyclase (GGDEF)-like protein/PAS domain S-box-containing protein